jgi:two-component system CheB/CheR fusion protein
VRSSLPLQDLPFANVRERSSGSMSRARPSGAGADLRATPRRARRHAAPASASFPVVGVGASAGGLDAFQQLLAHVPANAGLALVLVQHLAPTRASLLSDALARATAMKVSQAEDGARIEPDHVYVIPPGAQMAVERDTLRLSPRSDGAQRPHLPIDHFFRSLAVERGRQSIGVVLSGTASDGTEGLAAIRAHGGITFAQDPRSARFGEMPQSAIDAGVVDYSLPLPALGDELSRLSRHPYLGRREPVPPTPRGAASLARIFGVVRAACGVDFGEYKPATFKRRLARRMAVRKAQDIAAYLKLLQEDPGEVRSLHDDLLIHVTSFFRDAETFAELKATALPDVLKRKAPGAPVRAWVVGCATGEEAYSLAMSIVEVVGGSRSVHPVHVFGSDLSESAIERARAGVYSDAAMREVGEERRSRFFVKCERGWRVDKALRDLCVFARHDVARDPPFSRLDLVSCRNVLIYFGHGLQKRTLEGLHHSLNHPGYLLLGRSENVSRAPRLFAPATASGQLFARKPVPSTFRFTSLPSGAAHGPIAADPAERARTEGGLAQHVDAMILARYGPPGVVVNERLEVVQFRGRTGPYLEPPAGEPQTHLLEMARRGLRAPLRVALSQARKASAPVRKERVEVELDGSGRTCDIVVLPSQALGDGMERSFVVLFEERASEPARRRGAKPARSRRAAPRGPAAFLRLEEELASTNESLGSLIEEHGLANDALASANTELVSVNEELQSTNEELETAKEELQATNEELTTVNDELNGRNRELQLANADLVSLLETIEIPVAILDANRRIRRFTPQAGASLGLTPAALGKTIGEVATDLRAPDLELWIAQATRTGAMVESEVQDRAERWHRLQIRPHRALDGRADGTILSLVDIHALKHDVADAQWERDHARSLVEAVQTPIVVIDGQLRILSTNAAFLTGFGVSAAEIEGRGFLDVGGGGWDTPELRRSLGEVLAEDACFRGLEIERDSPGAGRRILSLSARSVESRASTPMILLGIEDVTERIQGERLRAELLARAERAQGLAEQANAAKDQFLAILSHELRTPLTSLLLQVELLRSGGLDPAKLKRVSAALERSVKLQLRLVEDLLDVSRIVAGNLRLEDQSVDLPAVVLAALELMRPAAEAKSLRIATDVAAAIPLFRGDPARLQQVVANLLANSIKASAKGGHLGVKLERVVGSARITVTDAGRGIGPEFLPRVFDRFAQEDGSRAPGHRGLGLGLAIVRHIMELHGGTIRAESPGRGLGATFTATLPLRDAVEAPAQRDAGVTSKSEEGVHAAPAGRRLAAVRVLVVDDDDDVRETVAELLAHEGAEVSTCPTVEAGLVAVETSRPDVVLCDLSMPGEDGFAFVRRLRALDQAKSGRIPAVAFTALVRALDRERCLAAGFQAHLAKPATRDALVAAVRSVLDMHSPSSALRLVPSPMS